jgi:hypothetical protein
MSTLEQLVARLRPPSSPEDRTFAARMLAEHPALEPWCAEPLIAALSDDASTYQEWSDWDGTVTGGSSQFARDSARAALLRLGVNAIEALAKHPAQRGLLAEIVAAASPDALVTLSRERLDSLPALVVGTSSEKNALKALGWRDAEGSTEAQRLIARLGHQTDSVVADACVALARLPGTREISDAIFTRLARRLSDDAVADRSEAVLEGLAPHAGDAAIAAFLAGRLGDDPKFHVLRAVLAWGPRARGSSKALMALLLRKLRGSNVVMEATLPAMIVAAALGPPTRADDVRVTTFLTVREKQRGVEQPPPDVLDALVKACDGSQHLAPFVIDGLTKSLVEGPNEARVDALPRLLALKQAAEPAGDALLVALEALIAANWTMAVSSACWTLAHAGAANQRALPKFISMLDGPHAFSAMHGLHGMSADAASAIPAVEAVLARAQNKPDRETAERLLRRIKHLAKVAP